MIDPAPQQPGPDAVGKAAGEPGILRGDQPIGKGFARILLRRQLDLGSIRKLRLYWSRGLAEIIEDNFLCPLRRGFVADPGEKNRHRRQSLLRPFFRPCPHEGQGDRLRQSLRFLALHRPVEIDWRVSDIAAARDQQFADKLVVRPVFLDSSPDPAMIGLYRIRPQVDGKLGFHPQQVAPFHCPVIGKFIAFQQPVDQRIALARRLINEK